MDNQSWDKAKLEEWKKFWESDMGKEALAKMQAIKEQMLTEAINQVDTKMITACVGRAAGIDLIMQDIQAGFNALANLKEKEEPTKKK